MLQPPFLIPPFWREARLGGELTGLLRSGVFRGEGVRDGRGQPVLLIPGFLAGDDSLGLMTGWLRRTGHHTRKAGMRSNVNCSELSLERLAERLEYLAKTREQRVAIVGQSRGGNFAKVLAARYPDLVSGIVTLGSPQLNPLDIHPFVRLQVYMVGTLGTLRLPGFFGHSCLSGKCCERFWEDLRGPLREDIGYVSIYSRSDGVVNWRSSLDPGAKHVEIDASHIGMALSPHSYRAIATALDDFRIAERARARRARPRSTPARVRRAA